MSLERVQQELINSINLENLNLKLSLKRIESVLRQKYESEYELMRMEMRAKLDELETQTLELKIKLMENAICKTPNNVESPARCKKKSYQEPYEEFTHEINRNSVDDINRLTYLLQGGNGNSPGNGSRNESRRNTLQGQFQSPHVTNGSVNNSPNIVIPNQIENNYFKEFQDPSLHTNNNHNKGQAGGDEPKLANGNRLAQQFATNFFTVCRLGKPSELQEFFNKHPETRDIINNVSSPKDGKTILFHTTACGNLESSKILIKHGARLDIKDNSGNNMLYCVASNGNIPMIEFLIDNGIDINAKNNLGATAVARAIECNRISAVKYLLSRNATLQPDEIRALKIALMKKGIPSPRSSDNSERIKSENVSPFAGDTNTKEANTQFTSINENNRHVEEDIFGIDFSLIANLAKNMHL